VYAGYGHTEGFVSYLNLVQILSFTIHQQQKKASIEILCLGGTSNNVISMIFSSV